MQHSEQKCYCQQDSQNVVISAFKRQSIRMINVEEFEQQTGWRGVFHCLPATRTTAQKLIMPLGYFYSPFLPEAQPIKADIVLCAKCKASISSYSSKNKNTKTWVCSFCLTTNPLTYDLGANQVEEYVQGKSGSNGMFFIVDLSLSASELQGLKETLLKIIQKLPHNIHVGLLAFNRNVFIYDFEEEFTKFICLNGSEDFGQASFLKLKQQLGFTGVVDPKFVNKIITTRHYVQVNNNNLAKITAAINSLKPDSHKIPRDQKQQRATGAALQIAIGLLYDLGINTRFVGLIGGPCTVGVGKVVSLPLKNTIRSYVDIFEGNQNTEHISAATAFYTGLAQLLVKNKHTMDIWAYGLDQFGLMEMKHLVNWSGGLLAMHELFNHFIFKTSFEKFYQITEDNLLPFPIACEISIKVAKQLKINGILGPGKSLKQNTLKTASEMQIGQGQTSTWYLGGIPTGTALCLMVSASDSSNQNKQRAGDIQAIVTYKWSDNTVRTRVSTIRLEYLRQNQIIEIGKRFDQEAGVVMLARMAAKKAEIQDTIEVKKWVDRTLLKFAVRFASFNRSDKNSFRLPATMKHFPQFIYHLRRSSIINPFGSPPDQALYHKTCLMRQSIPNSTIMIQPALIRYTSDSSQPAPVQLDISELKQDVILLLDSYFNVLVWYGQSAYGWKEQNLQDQPQYEYLQQFFTMPMQDASDIMYDRIPVSNFYETFKNDGKERYLKSRVNPSKSNKVEDDGHFVSDDAPITLFMDYLVRSVINYNE